MIAPEGSIHRAGVKQNGAVRDRKDRANQRRRRLEMTYASLTKQTYQDRPWLQAAELA
jgi:hypothetical protein